MMILDWIAKNIGRLSSEEYISLHLDELNIREDYFVNGVKLLNQIISSNSIFESNKIDLKIELQFELTNSKNTISCVPKSLDLLLKDIDHNVPPELIISLRKKGFVDYIPKIEYYMSPVPFILDELDVFYECHYSEYRTIDELLDSDFYTRWFTIVGLPPDGAYFQTVPTN